MVRGNKDGPRIWKGVREDHCMGSGAEGVAEGPPELGLPQWHVGGNQPLPVNGKGNVRYLPWPSVHRRCCRSSAETERACGCTARESFPEELRFELGLSR